MSVRRCGAARHTAAVCSRVDTALVIDRRSRLRAPSHLLGWASGWVGGREQCMSWCGARAARVTPWALELPASVCGNQETWEVAAQRRYASARPLRRRRADRWAPAPTGCRCVFAYVNTVDCGFIRERMSGDNCQLAPAGLRYFGFPAALTAAISTGASSAGAVGGTEHVGKSAKTGLRSTRQVTLGRSAPSCDLRPSPVLIDHRSRYSLAHAPALVAAWDCRRPPRAPQLAAPCVPAPYPLLSATTCRSSSCTCICIVLLPLAPRLIRPVLSRAFRVGQLSLARSCILARSRPPPLPPLPPPPRRVNSSLDCPAVVAPSARPDAHPH